MTDLEWIKLGIEVGSIAMAGLAAFFAVKIHVATLSAQLAGSNEAIKLQFASHNETIKGIQEEIKKLTSVVADQRVTDQRLSDHERRIGNNEQDIRMLRQGEGLVIPLHRSPYEHGSQG